MTFSEVYERILVRWPESISIADGTPMPNDGWYSETLSNASSDVEAGIDHREDTWGSRMAWTMFTVFHEEAQRLRGLGSDELLTRVVDRRVIEARFRENLEGEDWSEERAAYQPI
jgi:hypothetical protein